MVLGGVEIPHPLGLAGHSDADAVLHAITDAVLGAVGAGDIGMIFPDDDPRWAGADSSQFLRHAVKLAGDKGLRVGNCDVTILAEQPTIGPHRRAIQERIAELLGTNPADVCIKAKTGEGMGFIGRGEGIAVLAVVLVLD